MRVQTRYALAGIAVLVLAVLAESVRCGMRDLPAGIDAGSLERAERVVQELGPPDVRYRTTLADVYLDGVGYVSVRKDAVHLPAASSVEALFWTRACFFCARREFLALADGRGRIVFHSAASTGWLPPMMVTGEMPGE